MDLEFKSGSFEVKKDGGNLYIKGYAATFGVKDSYNDIINLGAFSSTLASDRNRIRFCYQHDMDKVIGKIIDIKEDSVGLYFEAKISNTGLGKDVSILVEDGALNEMSIGYRTKVSTWDDVNEIRYLVEVELAEISIVTRAANKEATISSTEVKGEKDIEGKNIDFDKISNERLQDLKKSIDKEFYKRILKRV